MDSSKNPTKDWELTLNSHMISLEKSNLKTDQEVFVWSGRTKDQVVVIGYRTVAGGCLSKLKVYEQKSRYACFIQMKKQTVGLLS